MNMRFFHMQDEPHREPQLPPYPKEPVPGTPEPGNPGPDGPQPSVPQPDDTPTRGPGQEPEVPSYEPVEYPDPGIDLPGGPGMDPATA